MASRVRKICLIFFTSTSYDDVTPFEQAFIRLGFEVEIIRMPTIWITQLTIKKLNHLKTLINEKKLQGYFVLFSPLSAELFLKEPDLTISYSGYRSWLDPRRVRIIPHLWTPHKAPRLSDGLRWTAKPPLRVGFMGRDFMTSRLVNIALKAPKLLKKWLLRGPQLRYPPAIAWLNAVGLLPGTINAFVRVETIRAIEASRKRFFDGDLDIVVRQSFAGSEPELDEYANHLMRNTYILCPRGAENYSFRIYEALCHGRIPVIIDTDIMLPKEIDWHKVSILVPYESLGSIYDIILRDYNSRSASEFLERQERALAITAELQTMRWVSDLAHDVWSVLQDA
jgi:hypothetical protein